MLKIALVYLVRSVSLFLAILAIGGLAHFLILEPSQVSGRSMEPNFFDEEIILIEKISPLLSELKRGQVVSVFDEFENLLLVKRIVGLPGERVILIEGDVYIVTPGGNNVLLEEPYLPESGTTFPEGGSEAHYGVIGKNQYFLLGDNRERSVDSRRYGNVHRSQIVGIIRKLPF